MADQIDFDKALFKRAEELAGTKFDDLETAATIVLSSIGTQSLTSANHWPVPEHGFSPKEGAIMLAFMTICGLSIHSSLKNLGIDLGYIDLTKKAALATFVMYSPEEKILLFDHGKELFIKMIEEAEKIPNLDDWINLVQDLTFLYIMEGEKKDLGALETQYLTLWNAREEKQSDSN